MNQIPKCTLVPTRYFDEKDPRCFLSELMPLDDDETVETVHIPEYDAVLVYVRNSDDTPEMYSTLRDLSKCREHNRIVAGIKDGFLYLAIAQGGSLLLCNVFPASDFQTAEYFIFSSVKSLQLNPEVSTICFRSPLSQEEELSLYRYFNLVERI